MEQLLNNAFFWQKLDTMIFTLDYRQIRAVGDVHPEYPNLIYPLEYGYLDDPDRDGHVVAKVFKGSLDTRKSDEIIVCVDILKKNFDIKILMGCTPEEQTKVLEFLNQTAFQKTVLIRRGDDMPDWAMED